LAGWFPCGLSSGRDDKPLLPSVLRLLVLNNIEDANVIKGTGHHGVLISSVSVIQVETTKGAVGRALTSFGVAV
jgi:hypothetical protein